MGGELLLAALGGCYMSTLLAAVRAREAPVHDVVAEVVGTLEDAPSRFTAIEMRISAVCEDLELLERLVTVAERGCLVANSLRHALPITISVAQRVQ
jgi:putative redox protein